MNALTSKIHMPVQYGSSSVLERIQRGYSWEAYVDLVGRARDIIAGDSPDGIALGISSDFISGYCGETGEEHQVI